MPPSTAPSSHSIDTATAPRVAVVIPCYNQAQYLAEAIESVVAQDYHDWHAIIIDDGSPDNTRAEAERLITKYKSFRIELIAQANQGPAIARNRAIAETHSEYILPLDADDKLHPSMIGRCVRLLDENPAIAIAYCDWQYFGAHTTIRHAPEYNKEILCQQENLFTCTSMFRRIAWSSTGGFNPNMRLGLEDWDFWVACAEHGFYGQRIPEVLFYYRAKDVGRNLTVQPHIRHMFARMVLNHPTLYPHETVINARNVLTEADKLEAKNAGSTAASKHALALLNTARHSIRDGNLTSAAAEIKQALATSQEQIVITEARSLMTAMEARATTRRATVLQEPRALTQAIENLKKDPKNETDAAVVRGAMNTVTQLIHQHNTPQNRPTITRLLSPLLTSGLQLRKQLSNNNNEPISTQTFGYPFLLQCIQSQPWTLQQLCPLSEIPAEMRACYIQYLLTLKDCCLSTTEREQIAAHFNRVTDLITTFCDSKAPHTEKVRILELFSKLHSCIPLYTSSNNILKIHRKRALLLERLLELSGYKLNYAFPHQGGPGKRFRIGYLSQHFGVQTETFVSLSNMRINRDIFEIHTFALTEDKSPTEAYAQKLSDIHTILPKDIASQVNLIRQKNLDAIIIGTNVTAVTNPICLLALHRLARVQIISYCSPVSTGFTNSDYFITGNLARLGNTIDHFSEKPLLVEGPPGCLDYTPENKEATPHTRTEYGLQNEEIVFINAASCYKITREALETWVAILADVPKSRLLLMPFNPNWALDFPRVLLSDGIDEICKLHRVDPNRITICPGLPNRSQVKEVLKLADIYLDVFPFSGSLSVIDPLEIGIPVITLTGTTFRSNFASSILHEIGLDELITRNDVDYKRLATQLAKQPDYREAIRKKILTGLSRQSCITAPALYGQRLSDALKSILTV